MADENPTSEGLPLGELLTLPLFELADNLAERDIEAPDYLAAIPLTESLLTEICQNPSQDTSISIALEDVNVMRPDNSSDEGVHQLPATLIVNNGPVISVTVEIDDATYVSPQCDFMPEFDLGDED